MVRLLIKTAVRVGNERARGGVKANGPKKSLACDGLSQANTVTGRKRWESATNSRESVSDGSRDAAESSEGSEVGGYYRERMAQNSFWTASSSLWSILFVAISSMAAVVRARIAPCRCFPVCLPSHASIKHSDSRGVFVFARILARFARARCKR